MKIDTKFDLGQVVYHAFTRFDSRAHAEECKTCEGVGTDLVPRSSLAAIEARKRGEHHVAARILNGRRRA